MKNVSADLDLAFDEEYKLQALVINQKGYIIASEGTIVNQSVLDIYDTISAAEYLQAFKTMHLYNNSLNNALFVIYNIDN